MIVNGYPIRGCRAAGAGDSAPRPVPAPGLCPHAPPVSAPPARARHDFPACPISPVSPIRKPDPRVCPRHQQLRWNIVAVPGARRLLTRWLCVGGRAVGASASHSRLPRQPHSPRQPRPRARTWAGKRQRWSIAVAGRAVSEFIRRSTSPLHVGQMLRRAPTSCAEDPPVGHSETARGAATMEHRCCYGEGLRSHAAAGPRGGCGAGWAPGKQG